MQITFLGSGSSSGVPTIGCKCHTCTSSDPKDKRLRSSILLTHNKNNLLIDASPDLRQQLLANDISHLEAILCTHAHFDHIGGIDELRSLNILSKKKINIYSTKNTLFYIKDKYNYAFMETNDWSTVKLISNTIDYESDFVLCGMNITPFKQIHNSSDTLGFRINNVAYCTDVSEFPVESEKYLQNLSLLIIGCIGYSRSNNHANFEQILELIDKFKPEHTILTHMGHEISYSILFDKLSANISIGYDNMKINI